MSGEQQGLNLRKNAYDFLNESIRNAERAVEEDTVLWKFAIVNIAQAIELLLKERLRLEHPLLVYTDVDRQRHTVNVEQALTRLAACNVAFDKEDLERLRRARDIRNNIVHFDIVIDDTQLSASYTDLFEFVHHFHLMALGEEVHPHIDHNLWMSEANLMEDFRREIVVYQGAEVINSFPSEILDAQFLRFYRIDGKEYPRIRRGSPDDLLSGKDNCHDCMVLPSQLHTPGCDAERCPRCRGQWISCDCEAEDYEYVDEIDDEEVASWRES